MIGNTESGNPGGDYSRKPELTEAGGYEINPRGEMEVFDLVRRISRHLIVHSWLTDAGLRRARIQL